jgi:hypothetical protein
LEYVVKSAHLVYNLAGFDIQKNIAAGQIKNVTVRELDIRSPKQWSLLPSVIAMHFARKASKYAKLNEVEPPNILSSK